MVNTKYKDATIKLFLKERKGCLVRLINSVRNTNYPENIELSENTLDTPVFMESYNDLSFCYDDDINLILIEHQSTINENMALRLFMYLGRVYEKISKSLNIYATKRFTIPTPYLMVLYNGTADCPEAQTLRLSDSFAVPTSECEVIVHMYNINYDENKMPRILEENPELKEYAAFIKKARDYLDGGYVLEDALRQAILDFSDTDVMGPFLENNASEVLSMLMTEWNTVDYGKVQRAEGVAEGIEKGTMIELERSIRAIMDGMHCSFDEAVRVLNVSEERIVQLKLLICQ